GVPIGVFDLGGHRLPSVPLGSPPAGVGQPRGPGGVRQERSNRVGQGRGITGRNQQGFDPVPDDLPPPVDVRGHDGQSGGHGFHQDDAEALPAQGGTQEQVRGGVVGGQVVV